MKNRTSKSSLFLMELIIAILFFAIASGMCMQIFVKAHLLTQQTDQEQNALVVSDSIIATLKNADGDLEEVESVFHGTMRAGQLSIFLNKDFQVTKEEKSVYIVMVYLEETEQYRIDVKEQETGKQILRQSIFCHKPLGE